MRLRRLIILLAAIALFIGCEYRSGKVVVAGKTVYEGMGIEGANVVALAGSEVVDETTSTYHGSFILHLPRGSYTLRAVASLPAGMGELNVKGAVEGVVVESERIDRLTINMVGE